MKKNIDNFYQISSVYFNLIVAEEFVRILYKSHVFLHVYIHF